MNDNLALHALQIGGGRRQDGQCFFNCGKVCLTLRGQCHAPRSAFKEDNAKVAFKLLDALRDSTMRQVQLLGCALEIAVTGGCRKDAQRVEVQICRHTELANRFSNGSHKYAALSICQRPAS